MPIFRFAPSPNGRLHLGHAYSALLNAKLAQQTGGTFLVRIEDIDITRCSPTLADQCLTDLLWLGIEWDEGVRIQSEHWADYTGALISLISRDLLYPCFCTRKEIAEAATQKDPDGAPLYPGTCRHIPSHESENLIEQGVSHSWRLNMDNALALMPGPHSYTRFALHSLATQSVAANPARWGDVILARKEIPTSYHISVVVDDALQNITHVVRGADLEAATDLHTLLQTLLNLPKPLYHHHPLLTGEEGDKLSKSKNSPSIAQLREDGVTPASIRQQLLA